MRKALFFADLDLRYTYYLIRIKEIDTFKAAFGTWHGQCESRVIPSWLNMTLAMFQAYMDDYLLPDIDNFTSSPECKTDQKS